MTNTFSSDLVETANDSPLPAEDRFACLPGCGLCCSYRVRVSEADRQRLRAAGALASGLEPWETTAEAEPALRRGVALRLAKHPEPVEGEPVEGEPVEGELGERARDKAAPNFCLFLDAQQRCTVYDHRPDSCRAYPYLWTTYSRPELDVDFSCPGLGQGATILTDRRQHLEENIPQQVQREGAIRQVRDLLRAQRRYASPKTLAALGERCLDELVSGWPVATLRVSQSRPLSVNAKTPDGIATLWAGLSLVRQPVADLLADVAFVERHFGRPRWNTRLGPQGVTAVYCFGIAQGTLHVEQRGGSHREIALLPADRSLWQREALATRRAYLERWLKRQLLARLANNLAVANLLQGSHVATCYLEFLAEIDWRLAVLAPALAQVGGKKTIDRAVVLEAIRGSDGLLRAWCQSARVGVMN